MVKDLQRPSEDIISLSKAFIRFMMDIDPVWTKAFYRFHSEPSVFGSNASYLSDAGVSLVSSIKWGSALRELDTISRAIFRDLEMESGVLLLTVDDQFSFDVKFESDDLSRWRITKLDGASGIPEGL